MNHCIPIPNIPRFCWYVLEFSASWRWHVDQYHRCSAGYRGRLSGLGTKYGTATATNIATSYYSTCLLLNVLLTLMIVTRLILHIRDVRETAGASKGFSGLHAVSATVVTMLIESYALYAVALLSFVVSWAVQSGVGSLLSTVVGATQVRGDLPFPRWT